MSTSTSTPTSSSSSSSFPPSSPSTAHRLSLNFPSRVLLSTSLTFPALFLLGLASGSRTHALRFRAENAHRLPRSQAGWYMYYKSKKYASLLGGIREGARNGLRVSLWSAVFLCAEEVVDRGRRMGVPRVGGLWGLAGAGGGGGGGEDGGHHGAVADLAGVDALGTVIASLATAGAFSLWNRFSYATTVRTAKRGLAFGLAYGLAQDVLRAAKGTAGVPAWMRWIGVGTAEHGGLVGHQQQQKRQPI